MFSEFQIFLTQVAGGIVGITVAVILYAIFDRDGVKNWDSSGKLKQQNQEKK
jgi:hypothetical protein